MSEAGPDAGRPVPSPQPGDAESDPPLARSTTIKTLAFIFVIQLFALAITKVNAPVLQQIVQTSGYPYNPSGASASSPTGSFYNAALLVIFVFAITLAAVWLARKRKVKIFMAMIFLGTGLALFLLTLLASVDLTGSYMSASSSFYVSLAFASCTVLLLSLLALRKVPASLALVLTGLLSAEAGSYFASAIPLLTAILLPLAFSVYDIYTVFKGPLKTLINTLPEESLGTMSSKIGEFSIGTGDTVFYSMIPALGYFQFGFGPAFVALLAVDVGVVVTLYLLSRVKLLPGLPIPMALGVAVLLLFYLR